MINQTVNVSTVAPQTFVEPKGSVSVRLVIFSVVIFSSLVGNFVVVKAYRQQPYLRKPFTYLLVTNLAIAELIGTVCLPFFLVYDELMRWPFGDSMCRLVNAFMLISYFVIPWSLAAIAFLRCKAFSSGQLLNVSGRFACAVLLLIWIMGAIVSAPTYVFAKQITSPYEAGLYWCIELFPGDTLATFPSDKLIKYYFVRFILNFALPGVIITICYGGVAMKLKRHLTAKKCVCSPSNTQMTSVIELDPELPATSRDEQAPVSTQPEGLSIVSQVTCPAAHENNSTGKEQVKEMENDLLRMIYIIIVIYLVCYIPYQGIFLMEYFWNEPWMKSKYYVLARKYIYLMTCFPSALHPICYGTMSKFYAQAFSTLILCKTKRKRPSTSNI